VTELPQRRFATAPFLVGTLLLLCALTFYYFAVLRIDYHKTALLDLGPGPDAMEYFAQAKAMLYGKWPPSIQIGYEKLPSRFPFGYPVLIVPWLKVLPTSEAILAPFRTSQTVGLLLLLGVFVTYAYLAMPISGGFAVLLLATMPAFFTLCRASLSDITGSTFVVFAFVFVYLGLEERRRWKIYLGAILLGAAFDIRTQLLFFAPLLLAMALFPGTQSRLTWLFHCVAVLLAFAIAASPMFLINHAWFQNPFSTGYDFWVPPFGAHNLFSVHNIPKHAAMLWAEMTARWQTYSVANIFGTGTHFVPPFILLTCIGFLFIKVSRFVLCALLSGFSFFAGTATNFFALCRYYLPVLILLIAVAVLAVDWATRMIFARKQVPVACLIFGLFLLSCVGFPSQSGFKPKGGRSQAWDALHFADPSRQSSRFIAQEWFVRVYGRQPGIVLSDVDPVYLNALLPKPFVAAPLDGKHRYRYSKIWRYDRPEALALVKRNLNQSLPVYALFVSQKEMSDQQSRLPVLPGYEWAVLDSSAKAVTLKLAPTTFQEKASP
jgi:4-amino-4-deoxy-L-arabinose transferase-like glycosyltransferase